MKQSSKLKVDLQPHIDAGMTILTDVDVEEMRSCRVSMNWPEDYRFPVSEGISMEEAREAMRKCK